ncbi:hypothetical protein FRC11_013102 [Ceratobasidium sp. 423]|nr:hypothetical protein FRC11_013102 [Ceratobasidium sp. 423]
MTADLSQAVGGIMNLRWVAARHISTGRFCTAQAAIKQFSNVGAALWSIVIAIHTFRLLMFVSAGVSVIVYTMVFFRLRGNLIAEGYRIRVLSVSSSRAWNLEAGRAVMESNTMSVAWQLMWYPVSYTFTILPIAASRWAEFSGATIPLEAKMFASVVFMLSGFINTLLFLATRRVLPPIKLRRKSTSGTSNAHPGISINISVHATRTQQISSANGEPSYVITLPPPKFSHIEGQTYELEDCSHLPTVPEKAERRLSGESTGISVATGKDVYDPEDGLGPRIL